ncbi:required for respiratory growth protein 9, mitochondrial [Aspergillus terricola var. indicus]
MPSICPKSAMISLPTVLQSIFSFEVAPQIRNPSVQSLDRSSLFHHRLRSRRTITTISIDSIPVPSAQKPEILVTTQSELFPADSSTASDTSSSSQASKVTSAENSSPARRTKTNTKTPNEKQAGDRDNKKNNKKSAKETLASNAPKPPKQREPWQIQKEALKRKFPAGWAPPKKLSPDAMEGIRYLHHIAPDQFTTPVLAEEFKVSPEAIRRILRSKWRPSGEELEERRKRWEKRHDRIWSHLSELGLRPKAPDHVSDADAILYRRKSKGV